MMLLGQFSEVLSFNVDTDYYVNKETFEFTASETRFTVGVDTTQSPMIPEEVNIGFTLISTDRYLDYGLEVELPEMENIMSQEEYEDMLFAQLLERYQIPEDYMLQGMPDSDI